MGMAGDMFSGGLSGATAGAGVGSMFGPWGAGIGGGVGLLGGMFQGFQKNKANQGRKQAIGQARLKLEELARGQRAQRQQDMQAAMKLFDPVQDEMTRLYGG